MTELQLAVMRILWDKGEAGASEVQAALRPGHKLAATTVSTVLARMAKRGDISMRREGRHFLYSAKVSETGIAMRKLNDVANLLFSGSSAAAISHLLDASDLDQKELRALQRQIAEKEKQTSAKRAK